MSRSKPVPPNFATNAPPAPDEHRGKAAVQPKILNGMAMPLYELPSDFDVTLHRQLYLSGDVKPITRAEIAARIKVLKQKKSQLG